MKNKLFILVCLFSLSPSVCFGALAATTVWEFQATADANNGGGFYDRVPGTSVDYSQQTSAQLSLTDLAMTTGGTTLTSETGGFTAAMAGNIIYIASGTHFTAGWYEIVTYTDTNTVELDRDATDGSNGSAGNGKVGGAIGLPTDTFCEQLVAGNICYVKKGTYTLTGALDVSADGTNALPIEWIGYNSLRTDAPTPQSGDQPTIACADNGWESDDYITFRNIYFTISTANGIRGDNGHRIINCKILNNSVTADRTCVRLLGGGWKIINCDLRANLGKSVYPGSASGLIDTCYMHDSDLGLITANGNWALINCIIDTMTTAGAQLENDAGANILNNTFYNCPIAITDNGSAGGVVIKNNIFHTCSTAGVSFDAELKTNFGDYNFYYGCTATTVNFTEGPNSDETQTKDPGFVNPANGNFAIGSALRSKGYPGVFPGGLSTGYISPGAVQPKMIIKKTIFF